MRKSFLILAAVLLVCSCSEKKESRAKAPIRVKMQVVSPSMADNSVTYVGIVEEREGTAVSFTGMGVVKRLLVNEGQAVARGQLIAEMDDTQARNLLAGAEATMKQANDAHQRYGMLHENGSLPEVKWVEIESKVEQAKSQLEVAKKNLADCRLTAPVSGIIGKKLIDAGETAMPSQAVVTILDISSVKVKVSVPEAEISHISSTTREEAPAWYGCQRTVLARRFYGSADEVTACHLRTASQRWFTLRVGCCRRQHSSSCDGNDRRHSRQLHHDHRWHQHGPECSD